MRIGAIADSHVSVERFDAASWHNPYRLEDSLERLRLALADPVLNDVDVVVVLGDLVHFGDVPAMEAVFEVLAANGAPTLVLPGNHDVVEDGGRLDLVLAPLGLDSVRTAGTAGDALLAPFRAAQLGLETHGVVETWPTPEMPFAVERHRLSTAADGAPSVVLTHFPIVSLRPRAEAAGLLYSGHLSDLADPAGLEPPDGPVVVLSGHLHLRGVAVDGSVLQIVLAALVEAPYEAASVSIDRDGDAWVVAYECASLHELDADIIPTLDPPTGAFRWTATQGWRTDLGR